VGDHGAAEREEVVSGRAGPGRAGPGRAGSVPRPRALGLDRDLLGAGVTYQFPAEGEPGCVGSWLSQSRLSIGAIVASRR
jgi:hypothetical protein